MKQNNDDLFLADILEFCVHIEEYINDVEKADFLKNRLLQDALVRKIELIGEASKGLSEKIRDENPQIPWKDIRRMRDKIIHHYFRLDLEIVWQTAKKDIVFLKQSIQEIIEKNGK